MNQANHAFDRPATVVCSFSGSLNPACANTFHFLLATMQAYFDGIKLSTAVTPSALTSGSS